MTSGLVFSDICAAIYIRCIESRSNVLVDDPGNSRRQTNNGYWFPSMCTPPLEAGLSAVELYL
jgi:hypothetical protein